MEATARTYKCTKCGVEQDASYYFTYNSRHRDGSVRVRRASSCRPCRTQKARDWRKNDPNASARTKNVNLKRKFGITLDEYNLMSVNQGGVCFICHQPSKWLSLAVDHDHSTNKVRALLCHGCNTSLGLVEENIKTLERMIAYIKLFKGEA